MGPSGPWPFERGVPRGSSTFPVIPRRPRQWIYEEEQDMSVIKTNPRETERIEGAEHGATISLILDHSEPGQGPRLHRHHYDETWVVVEGTVRFQAGDESCEAGPGDVVIVPANTPHKFTNEGPGPSRLVCIHANPTVIGEWLE